MLPNVAEDNLMRLFMAKPCEAAGHIDRRGPDLLPLLGFADRMGVEAVVVRIVLEKMELLFKLMLGASGELEKLFLEGFGNDKGIVHISFQ